MTLQVNQRMLALLGGDPEYFEGSSLKYSAQFVVAASTRFKEVDGCIVPYAFAEERIWTESRPSVTNLDDETGFETLHSKLHLEPLLPEKTDITELARSSLDFAFLLKSSLQKSNISGPIRIIASVREADAEMLIPATCTVRFHKIRSGQVWLNDDLDSYKDEAIMVMDF